MGEGGCFTCISWAAVTQSHRSRWTFFNPGDSGRSSIRRLSDVDSRLIAGRRRGWLLPSALEEGGCPSIVLPLRGSRRENPLIRKHRHNNLDQCGNPARK